MIKLQNIWTLSSGLSKKRELSVNREDVVRDDIRMNLINTASNSWHKETFKT